MPLGVAVEPHQRRLLGGAALLRLPAAGAEPAPGRGIRRRGHVAEQPDPLPPAVALRLPVAGTLGFAKAEVTSGGVALDEVEPKTLESRRQPGLHFAGEVLDLDGLIGGYNFQGAWSMGWLAGESV